MGMGKSVEGERRKSMMRKAIALGLVLAMVCGLAAGIAESAITIPVVEGMKEFEKPDNEALAFVRAMKAGWNLGNTFDAYDDDGWFKGTGDAMETAWVGTKARTTPEAIAAVHEAGFETLRLPVSWHNHVDQNDQIDPIWLNRVKEVADYALNVGMYVIVNVHHDNNKNYFYPDEEHYARSAQYLTAIWTQVANTFRDYDDHLILESMNEPRLVGTNFEWYWTESDAACQEAADCINRLNQLFVDTVRATGGQNATRYLAVPAYDASPYYAVNEAFQLPKDTADNRIIVSAHAYTPYDFALNLSSSDHTFDLEKDSKKKAEISQFLNGLYQRFVSVGIPVIMDEFGAMEKSGNLQDRVNFAAYYVAAASARGITCCWWDNHVFKGNGERFGIFDRIKCEWAYPEIVQAIQANCLYQRGQ